MANTYIIVQSIPYEGSHLTHFDDFDAMKKDLKRSLQSYAPDDFEVYEIAETIDVYALIKEFSDEKASSVQELHPDPKD